MSDRFSLIAHDGLPFAAPLDPVRIDAFVRSLELPPDAAVVDAGCGAAELLRRVVVHHGARGLGFDRSPGMIAEAQRRADAASDLVDRQRLELRVADAADVDLGVERWDAFLCVGSTHLYGALPATLATARRAVRPGGAALVGEGFWERPPSQDDLEAFGMAGDELSDLAGTVASGEAAGWTLEDAMVSSAEDWDAYEFRYRRNVARWLRQHPDDPDAAAFAHRSWAMLDSYLRWRRATMGFALLLYRRH